MPATESDTEVLTTYPIFLQNDTTNQNAVQVRQMLRGVQAGAYGIVEPSHLAVTGTGATKTIAAGSAIVPGTESAATQGYYYVTLPASVTVTVDGPSALDRYDLVVLRVRDSAMSGANNQAEVTVIKGDSGNSAWVNTGTTLPFTVSGVPSTLKNYIPLCQVFIPLGGGAHTMTDKRWIIPELDSQSYYSAYGEKSSVTIAGSAVWSAVIPNSNIQNPAGMFSGGVFTAKKAGVYLLSSFAYVNSQNASTFASLAWMLNGNTSAPVAGAQDSNNPTGGAGFDFYFNATGVVRLAEGDTVTLYHRSGGSTTWSSIKAAVTYLGPVSSGNLKTALVF